MKSISKNYDPNGNEPASKKSPHPFFLALILTGILAGEVYPNLTERAIAAVKVFQSPELKTNIKSNPTANKFALLLKSATDTKVEFNSNISKPYSLANTAVARILTVSQTSVNEEIDGIKKLSKPTQYGSEKIAQNGEKLPNNIANAVRQDLARQIGISPENVEVTKASTETWPNTCLGLPKSDELCGEMLVLGWRIVLSHGSDTWVYRTDTKGKLIRAEGKNSSDPPDHSKS